MKICVFSDSHGDPDKMIEAVRRERPDYVFFLGDGERDLDELRRAFPRLAIAAVRGNCDLFSELPAEVTLSIGGFSFFLTHGHRCGVKIDPYFDGLRAAAARSGAQAALFGHTHEAFREEQNGLLLMNPGSARGYGASCGVIEIEDGRLLSRIERL